MWPVVRFFELVSSGHRERDHARGRKEEVQESKN